MDITEEKTQIKPGKAWDTIATFDNFDDASKLRESYKYRWEAINDEGMQVKIRRTAEGRFVVKTRLHPDFDIKSNKKGKKSGKNRNNSKGNTNKGKAKIPTTSV